MKNYHKSIEDYNKLISLNPKLPMAYFNRAQIYFNLKDYKHAIEDCNSALKLNNKIIDAELLKAQSYHNLKQDKQAIAQCQKLLKFPNDNVKIKSHYLLALIYKGNGNKAALASQIKDIQVILNRHKNIKKKSRSKK